MDNKNVHIKMWFGEDILGNDVDGANIAETMSAYCYECASEVRKAFPDAAGVMAEYVNLNGAYEQYNVYSDSFDRTDEIREAVSDICDEVFSRGSFWVMK